MHNVRFANLLQHSDDRDVDCASVTIARTTSAHWSIYLEE